MEKTDVSHDFMLRLRELMDITIYSIDTSNIKDVETKHEQVVFLLNEFNQFVKTIIEHNDNGSLTVTLNELELFNDNFFRDIYDYDLNDQFAEYSIHDDSVTVSKRNLSPKLYAANKRLFNYSRAIPFGNYAFMYYKFFYNNNKGIIDEINSLLLEKYFYSNYDFIQFLFEIHSSPHNFLNWDDWIWKIEKRLNGQAYTLPSREDFLYFGNTVFLIRNSTLRPEFKKEILNSGFTDYFLNRSEFYLQQLREHASFWYLLLKCPTEEELQKKITQLEEYFKSIRLRKDNLYYENLAAAPISNIKSKEFIDLIVNQWKNTQNLTHVFEYFDAIKLNPDFELKRMGLNTNFQRAKVMFVESEQYMPIHNIDWGKDVNRNKEETLGRVLKESSLEIIEETEFIKNIDSLILDLDKKGFPANLILTTASSFHKQDQQLVNSGNYLPVWQDKLEKYPFNYLGVYKSKIPIVRIHSRLFSDKAIILNLREGLTLFEREKEEWIDKRLQISIKTIDNVKAEEIYNEKPDQYSSFSKEHALNIIKSGIIIDIDEIADFKVVNRDAIRVLQLNKM